MVYILKPFLKQLYDMVLRKIKIKIRSFQNEIDQALAITKEIEN